MKKLSPFCIVFSLLMLSLFLIDPVNVARAGDYPTGVLTWEYSEFTKAFRTHLENNSLAHFVPLIVVVIIGLLCHQYYQNRLFKQKKLQELAKARSAVASLPEQRRAWHRIQSSLDCSFNVIHNDESSPTLHKGRIVDLSGGGCRIASKQNLQIGDSLLLNLQLNSRQKLAIKGTVVRTEFENSNCPACTAGIQFLDMSEKARDYIIKWMFKHQQAMAEGTRRVNEGLCLRCGKPLPIDSREDLFCFQCQSIRETES